jgi:hypothetical protein
MQGSACMYVFTYIVRSTCIGVHAFVPACRRVLACIRAYVRLRVHTLILALIVSTCMHGFTYIDRSTCIGVHALVPACRRVLACILADACLRVHTFIGKKL